MNATQATARLRKLLGPKATIRDDRRPSSQEQRDAQHAARMEANATKTAAQQAMEARRTEVLNADAEYQLLKFAYQSALAIQGKTSMGRYYRYTAGRVNTVGGLGFFHVDAEADTLAELVEKVEQQKAAA